MAATATPTSRRSYSGPVLRSISPTRRFSSSSYSSSSLSSSSFKSITQTSSLRFTVDRRASSPNRSISHSTAQNQVMSQNPAGPVRRSSCMCSPTNHPGSFRCSLHKNNGTGNSDHAKTTSYCTNKLRRSAMVNSVVRIGAVEGVDMVKRSLAALIRPSSHQVRRRENFQRRPSRLSVMSKSN